MVDHQARAQALYDSRLYEQAEKELERLVTSNEADSYTYELLSFVQVELRRFPEAIASGKLAVQLAPEDGASHYALANAYFYAQRLNDAETAIQEAIRRDPETARYHRLASGVSYHLFRFDEALARAELALELDPASSAGMSAKVSALLALNRNDEADKLLQTALQLDPESSSLFISKGRMLFSKTISKARSLFARRHCASIRTTMPLIMQWLVLCTMPEETKKQRNTSVSASA